MSDVTMRREEIIKYRIERVLSLDDLNEFHLDHMRDNYESRGLPVGIIFGKVLFHPKDTLSTFRQNTIYVRGQTVRRENAIRDQIDTAKIPGYEDLDRYIEAQFVVPFVADLEGYIEAQETYCTDRLDLADLGTESPTLAPKNPVAKQRYEAIMDAAYALIEQAVQAEQSVKAKNRDNE